MGRTGQTFITRPMPPQFHLSLGEVVRHPLVAVPERSLLVSDSAEQGLPG